MNRYSKYSSTLIKNWLLKNGCVLSHEASTSESIYLRYGDVKIRISNHLPGSPVLNTLYLMIPVNNSHSFGVFLGKNFNSLISIKELKSFLKAIFLVLDIKTLSQFTKIKLTDKEDVLEKDEKIKKLETKIGNLHIQLRDQKKRIDNQTAQLRILQNKK